MSSRRQEAAGQATRRRMLKFIADHQAEHGWAPTMAEIATAMGLASKASVHRHLNTLHQQGELVLGNGTRMIRLTGGRIELRPDAGGSGEGDGTERGVHPATAVRNGSPSPAAAPSVRDEGRLRPGR